jgi:hypothetical protein
MVLLFLSSYLALEYGFWASFTENSVHLHPPQSFAFCCLLKVEKILDKWKGGETPEIKPK